jgi:GxxExxY protein
VENAIVVELKSVESIHPVFVAQLLTYLKLSEKPKGLLINFHTSVLKDSVISKVTEQFANLPEF